MVRDFGEATGVIAGTRSCLELGRDRGVQSATVTRQERVVDGLAHQGMPERVSLGDAVVFDHQQARGRRLPER